MGKFRPKKLLISLLVFSIVGIVILTNVSSYDAFGVILNVPPNAFVYYIGQDGKEVQVKTQDFENAQIACWVQAELKIKNNIGKVFDQEFSSYLKVNPTVLSLVDRTNLLASELSGGEGQGGFRIEPIIKCSTAGTELTPEDTFSEDFGSGIGTAISPPKVVIPIVVEATDLVVRIYSSDLTNQNLYHDIFNGKLVTSERNIRTSEPVGLGYLDISDLSITKYLEKGKYESNQIVTLDGLLKIHFDCSGSSPVTVQACNAQKYVIPLSTTRTFVETSDSFIQNSNVGFWGGNNWKDIKNVLTTDRKLSIEKGTSGDGTGGDPVICTNTSQIVVNNVCVDIVIPTGDECKAQGKVLAGTICVDISGGGNNGGNGGEDEDQNDILAQLNACIKSGSTNCLANKDFLPLYLGGFGFSVLIGAMLQTKPIQYRPTDIYGVPT